MPIISGFFRIYVRMYVADHAPHNLQRGIPWNS
jgi:hypothetical protein